MSYMIRALSIGGSLVLANSLAKELLAVFCRAVNAQQEIAFDKKERSSSILLILALIALNVKEWIEIDRQPNGAKRTRTALLLLL